MQGGWRAGWLVCRGHLGAMWDAGRAAEAAGRRECYGRGTHSAKPLRLPGVPKGRSHETWGGLSGASTGGSSTGCVREARAASKNVSWAAWPSSSWPCWGGSGGMIAADTPPARTRKCAQPMLPHSPQASSHYPLSPIIAFDKLLVHPEKVPAHITVSVSRESPCTLVQVLM